MTATMTEIKTALLSSDDGFALDMLSAVEVRAQSGGEYGEQFAKWMKRGGTVILRDILCAPFRNSSIVENYRASHPLPFDNMWDAIDSAWLKCQRKAGA